MQEVVRGIWRWEVEDEEGVSMASYALAEDGGTLVLDPAWDADAVAQLERMPGPVVVLISTRSHVRDARRYQDRLAAPIAASARLARDVGGVNRQVAAGEVLDGGWRVLEAPGVYAGEVALHRAEGGGILYVGDLFTIQAAAHGAADDAPSVALLPERLIGDPATLRRTLGRLTDLAFDTVLAGHGPPILGGGRERVRELALGR